MLRPIAAVAVALIITACTDRPLQPPDTNALPNAPVLAAGPGTPIFVDTYGPFAPVPCNGTSRNGIAYAFAIGGVPSVDCAIATLAGPGATNNIAAPNIEGNANGTLTLTFDVPTTVFGFGVAQSTGASPQSVVIDLFRPGVGLLREQVVLTTTNDPGFVGGRYDYEGPAVKTASISFSNTGPPNRFAIDNTTYFRPRG